MIVHRSVGENAPTLLSGYQCDAKRVPQICCAETRAILYMCPDAAEKVLFRCCAGTLTLQRSCPDATAQGLRRCMCPVTAAQVR